MRRIWEKKIAEVSTTKYKLETALKEMYIYLVDVLAERSRGKTVRREQSPPLKSAIYFFPTLGHRYMYLISFLFLLYNYFVLYFTILVDRWRSKCFITRSCRQKLSNSSIMQPLMKVVKYMTKE